MRREAALVTGGAVRLGRAIAVSLADMGFDIALHFNSSFAEAKATAEDIRAKGVQCDLFQQDLSDQSGPSELFNRARRTFPLLSVLINNASTYTAGNIRSTEPEVLEELWKINFRAPFLLLKEFCTKTEAGALVNILDNKIAFNQYHYAAYLGTKKALGDLTKMAALEFAPNIRVNGVAPGVVMPASTRSPSYLQWRQQGIPVSALGDPTNICQAIEYLLRNSFVTGQILFVDGGEAMNITGQNSENFDGQGMGESDE